MYGRAVLQAQKTDGPRVEAVALINLSREEMLAGNNSEASAKLSKARKLAKRAQGADLQTMLARVEASFSEQGLIVRDSG
jgi:ATP/maltotriose-dependent transcriptional regulator MalT